MKDLGRDERVKRLYFDIRQFVKDSVSISDSEFEFDKDNDRVATFKFEFEPQKFKVKFNDDYTDWDILEDLE